MARFYRLHVVPILLPPLAERKEDIGPLFPRFVKQAGDKEGRTLLEIDAEVLECLERFPWPGNIRELENLARRLVALNTLGRITPFDLPEPYADTLGETASPPVPPATLPDLPDNQLDLEKWVDGMVLKALAKNDWNQSRTARYLNISRNTLLYRMDKRGLQRQ